MPRKKNSSSFRQPSDDHAPPKLLAAARDSRLVIFAGAGISMGPPTNLPSWGAVNRIVVRSLAASAALAVGEPLAAKAADLILARHEQKKLPPEYQAQVLAELTGWDLNRIRSRMDMQPVEKQVWWKGLWR